MRPLSRWHVAIRRVRTRGWDASRTGAVRPPPSSPRSGRQTLDGSAPSSFLYSGLNGGRDTAGTADSATTSAGERSTAACRRPRLVPSRCCCPVDGPRRRYNVDRETSRAATVLHRREPAHRPPSRVCPVVEAATFPCTSMIRCAFLSSPLQLAYLLIQRTAALRQGLQRPAMRRLAPRRQVRRVGPLAAVTHLAGLGDASSTIRSLYDGLNRRRSGLLLRSAGAAASWPPRFQGHYHSLPFSLAVTCSFSLPSPYSNFACSVLTYVGREEFHERRIWGRPTLFTVEVASGDG